MTIDCREERWQTDKPGQCAQQSFRLTYEFFLGITAHASFKEDLGAALQTGMGSAL